MTMITAAGCHKVYPFEVGPDGGLDAEIVQKDVGAGSESSIDVEPAVDQFVPDLPCGGQSCGTLGCNDVENRCFRLEPSNGAISTAVKTNLDGVLASLVDGQLSGPGVNIHTDTGEISVLGGTIYRPAGSPGTVQKGIYYDVVTQAVGYPEIALFMVKSLNVAPGTKVAVFGKRAFALYVVGDVTIGAGSLLNAGAEQHNAGTGGFTGGVGNNSDADVCQGNGHGKGGQYVLWGGGGGGGGYGEHGGQGGDGDQAPGTGGASGTAVGNVNLAPLVGGCGGGAGGGTGTTYAGGFGGGGGGAIQISAGGTISVNGIITVPGSGGQGAPGKHGGGGGGGSGGAILLEAVTISIGTGGFLAANGGGGGSGGSHTPGVSGDYGTSTTTAASGHPGPETWSGVGGHGGALDDTKTAPNESQGQPGLGYKSTATTMYNGGGGGGGVGRIRLNSEQGTFPSGSFFSPEPTMGKPAGKW